MSWKAPGSATMGTASAQIVAADPLRRALILVNDSDSPIYISQGQTAIVNKGIRLNANGGAYEHDVKKYGLPTGDFYGISTGSSKNLTVTEGY